MYLWVTTPLPTERDRTTLCPVAGPKDIIVIAMDTTDGLPEPLIHALEGSLQPIPSKSSPLLSTFQGIALERFTGAKLASAQKRLVIVSDMVEHGPGKYTQYPPADLRYLRFKGLPVYRKVRTDLQGAAVDRFNINRSLQRFDTGAHITFWIGDNNGRMGTVVKLQGAGTIKVQGAGK